MADTDEIIESKADEATQKKASDMGWQGPDKFKGDPTRFIDADKFLENAETFVPFLKAEKRRLNEELGTERAARVALEGQVTDIKASLDSIEERYTVETQKRVEGAKKELRASIKEAADSGDLKAVVALTSELDDLNETERAALAEEAKEKTAAAAKKLEERPTVDPVAAAEAKTWIDDHAWMRTDKKKASIFYGFCEARRSDGDVSIGKKFFDAVLEDMEEALDKDTKPKVEGGKNGSGEGGGGNAGKGKSYADMPADAKKACMDDAKKFVGAGKKYPDNAAWQKSYAALYFRSNNHGNAED